MSDIICQWLNIELRLSKVIEPYSFTRDFANGYLIGEILHRYELQDDFHQFSKQSTANAKLNNFTRIEPTLQLLGVPLDLTTAKAVMQGRQGAATRLLYQLYILLQKKKKLGLTATAMEVMQPAATARLHRIGNSIYTERLKTVVKRETDMKMQKIAIRFHKRGQHMYNRSVMTELLKEEDRLKQQEERRLRDIEKHRQARRKQHEIMIQIQSAIVQIPKPPHARMSRASEKQIQFRKKQEAEYVHREIAQFERNQKRISPAGGGAFLYSGRVTQPMTTADKEQWNKEYIENIRQRLEEDSAAREQREMRRRRALMEQLQAHEAQQEVLREEQMLSRLMRQTQQEKRIAVQLMQIKQQKEVLRQNRIFQERQYQERRLRDFQEALDREVILAQQERLERSEEIRMERELHKQLVAERTQARYRKHFDICGGILGQIVDLATKVGEYRLLTANLIPVKLMQEWMELFFSGKPLYEVASVDPTIADPTPEQIVELEKSQILNNQDYNEYVAMKGEWVCHEDDESQAPPVNDILDHVLSRLQSMIVPPGVSTPPPLFPRFTIRACMLGKSCSGKTTCLAKISNALGIHVLSANSLIQDSLAAYQQEKQAAKESHKESQNNLERYGSPIEQPQREEEEEEKSSHLESGAEPEETSGLLEKEDKEKWSLRAQRGAAVEQALRAGKAVPDQLLVDIIVDAIMNIPADSGWILDGFPVDISQAQMLEKALNGTEPDQADTITHSISAKHKNTPKDSPLPCSALDVVVLLDISDEQVLERATRQPVDGEEEQETDGSDAPDEKTSITDIDTQDAALSDEKNLGRKQIQHRINGFHDTWPKLEKWFGDEQNILLKVTADVDEDTVFSNVKIILMDTMDSVEKGVALVQSRKMSTFSSAEHSRPESASSAKSKASNPKSAGRRYVEEPLPKEIPVYLVPYWESVCNLYVTNLKTVMQNLRGERELIIHHLYNIRENFRQYLQKPDLKQEFVSAWQRDYNSVPDNIREDEETKGELHQRLDDLRERLWDICDKRKEEAAQERAGVIDDGWLDDHTAVLINHYSALMQIEVGRFQDSLCLLRDYYTAMCKTAFPESIRGFARVPLIDITADDHVELEEPKIPAPAPPERLSKSAQEKDSEMEDKKKSKLFPLVSCRSPTSELLRQVLHHPDEKLLQEFFQTAFSAVRSMVLAETQQREEEEGDEEQKQMEAQKVQTSNSATDNRKAGKKKGAPTPPQEPSPQPVVERNPEEVKRRAERKRIKQEFTAALRREEHAVKLRLELIKAHALRTVSSLRQRAEQAYGNMEEWLGSRFLSEMNSIDQLTELVRQHIENGVQIHHEMVLQSSDFCVDGDTLVVASLSPAPRRSLLESPKNSTLTVQQLHILYAQLSKTAPTGLMCKNELADVLHQLTSHHVGSDVLPDPWMNITLSQVDELMCVLTLDSEMLDWRKFLLSAALPWPFPSQTQLLKTLQRYRAIDTAGTGLITQEQYAQVELWFPSERDLPVPDDPTEPLPYDRLANLKKFFFSLFASTRSSPLMLDYLSMLLYFCCHPEPAQGFTRALSLVTGHTLHYKHTSPLTQSVPYMEGAGVEECGADEEEEEERGVESDEVGVSVDDVLRVLSHGNDRVSSHHRFQPNHRSRDELREELLKMFKELGFKDEEKISFSTLSQHPFVQDLMEASSQYLLSDIHKLFRAQ
ncbi:LOW QUALITY PROTEIN: sperm flagellar protein 2-like [Puntigrus tetrazona]|uniref:LOW QUALITY PROTEIN: sperm flagellar protein 2-like n=1 Tax=Puntigrus tetrazona TaxID=1606681 RepID=UPI001C89D0D2|nr:LOW QUALITY PROTEIN: sperm flagellar protein 2-like [Puntigrus tetrazona]